MASLSWSVRCTKRCVAAAPGTKNIIIRNGSAHHWGGAGIGLGNAGNVRIGGANIGITVGPASEIVHCEVAETGSTGISGGDDARISDCTVTGALQGIMTARRGLVTKCNASSSTNGQGISVRSGSTVRECLASSNAGNTSTQLLWASTLSRLYAIDTTTDLGTLVTPPTWIDLGLDSGPNSVIPSIGTSTTRTVVTANSPKRFFRVRAIRPLVP